MRIIDFDEFDVWGSWVGEAIEEIAPAGLIKDLTVGPFLYIEDAADRVIRSVGVKELSDHLITRLRGCGVRFYHGTRLTEAEVASIRATGLRSLVLAERKSALKFIFERHPRWAEVEGHFDEAIQLYGPGNKGGVREDGCVHVCFSKVGLMQGCNHYLTHGAEVDGHVAYELFGDASAAELISEARRPKLITFVVSFEEAMACANPYGVSGDELPSILDILVCVLAFKQSNSHYTAALRLCDVAARLPRAVSRLKLRLFTIWMIPNWFAVDIHYSHFGFTSRQLVMSQSAGKAIRQVALDLEQAADGYSSL